MSATTQNAHALTPLAPQIIVKAALTQPALQNAACTNAAKMVRNMSAAKTVRKKSAAKMVRKKSAAKIKNNHS